MNAPYSKDAATFPFHRQNRHESLTEPSQNAYETTNPTNPKKIPPNSSNQKNLKSPSQTNSVEIIFSSPIPSTNPTPPLARHPPQKLKKLSKLPFSGNGKVALPTTARWNLWAFWGFLVLLAPLIRAKTSFGSAIPPENSAHHSGGEEEITATNERRTANPLCRLAAVVSCIFHPC